MTQAVELLPSNHKALTSNPSTKKRRKWFLKQNLDGCDI
jgi:hypothetical protein